MDNLIIANKRLAAVRKQRKSHVIVQWFLLLMFSMPAAHAHLMVAQHGSINFVENGAFTVLSVPVSAIKGIDNNNDELLSPDEFKTHRPTIENAIKENVSLFDSQESFALQGLMIMPSWPDNKLEQRVASQIVIMGRFNLNKTVFDSAVINQSLATDSALEKTDYKFSINLFGTLSTERQYRITLTRPASNTSQLILISQAHNTRPLFRSSTQLFTDYVAMGVKHVALGLDHMLFLLLVLAAGLRWKQVLGTLTLFTVGHAISLYLSVKGFVLIPASIVEPAIAATILIIVAFDLYRRYSRKTISHRVRHALIFTCAMIHGLGFAYALTELGLNQAQLLPGLLGFNMGIELGQISIALLLISAIFIGKHAYHTASQTPKNFKVSI